MKFVELAVFNNYIEAHIVQSRLEEEGVRCWLQNEHSATIAPYLTQAIGGIRMMVSETQLDRALEILNDNRNDEPGL